MFPETTVRPTYSPRMSYIISSLHSGDSSLRWTFLCVASLWTESREDAPLGLAAPALLDPLVQLPPITADLDRLHQAAEEGSLQGSVKGVRSRPISATGAQVNYQPLLEHFELNSPRIARTPPPPLSPPLNTHTPGYNTPCNRDCC